jgi:hypothetical protein
MSDPLVPPLVALPPTAEDVAPSPVVRPAPDPERDARVAARREAARRRASADLDRFIADIYGTLTEPLPVVCGCKYAQCFVHDRE